MSETTVESAKTQIRRVISLLRSGDSAWAGALEGHLAVMDGRFATKEAFFKIGEACHPKALGDVFLPGIPREDWSREIELLEILCAEAFSELERSGP